MMKQRMILLLTAFGIRLAVGWWLGHFHHPRIWEYEEIANHLLAGQGYFYEHLGTPYRAFMAPLYPLVYASVCAVTNHTHSILVILHCALSAFATLQVYAIGMLIFKNPSIAQLGAWLVAFHPGLILYASRLHILNADVFAFLWVLWAWLGLFQSSSWTKAIQVGFASGFAILIRGTIILFLLFAMIVFLWSTPVFQRIKALKLVG